MPPPPPNPPSPPLADQPESATPGDTLRGKKRRSPNASGGSRSVRSAQSKSLPKCVGCRTTLSRFRVEHLESIHAPSEAWFCASCDSKRGSAASSNCTVAKGNKGVTPRGSVGSASSESHVEAGCVAHVPALMPTLAQNPRHGRVAGPRGFRSYSRGIDGFWSTAEASLRVIRIAGAIVTHSNGNTRCIRFHEGRFEVDCEGLPVSAMLRVDDCIHWSDGQSWHRRSAGIPCQYNVGDIWAGFVCQLPKPAAGTEWLFYRKHEVNKCSIFKLHALGAAPKACTHSPPPRSSQAVASACVTPVGGPSGEQGEVTSRVPRTGGPLTPGVHEAGAAAGESLVIPPWRVNRSQTGSTR